MSARGKSIARCPIRGEYCGEHGFVHGYEAEQLRKGVEILVGEYFNPNAPVDDCEALRRELKALLDRVDARDSLAFVEAPKRAKRPSRAQAELTTMLVAILRDAKDLLGLGGYRARKKLTNGAIVSFSIKMPPEPR